MPATTTIQQRIDGLNIDLGCNPRYPIRLELRGHSIGLRGKLPLRDCSGFKVQRLPLGAKADEEGIRKARQTAYQIQDALINGSFRWDDWDPKAQRPESLDQILKQFETAFFNDPERLLNPSGTLSTWKGAYAPYLKRLKQIQQEHKLPLNQELLMLVLKSYSVGSRSRAQCGTALRALAHPEKITLPEDWGKQSKGYKATKIGKRILPTDQQIIQAWSKIPNPAYRWIFGMLATYGLRPHEAFLCDVDKLLNDPKNNHPVRVLSTSKTGEHLAFPLQKNWVKRFDLANVQIPNINRDVTKTTLQNIGKNVHMAFRRYNVGFPPYELRHAWAVRSIHSGMNQSIAAAMMGHSVSEHTDTYHFYMTEQDMERGYMACC